MKKHIALILAGALVAGTFTPVVACGITECQPCGGLTSRRECNPKPTATKTASPTATPKVTPTATPSATPTVPPTATPQPPRGGGVPSQEEETPPTPTASPTPSPTPSVGLVPPVSTTVPTPVPTPFIPTALPKAGG